MLLRACWVLALVGSVSACKGGDDSESAAPPAEPSAEALAEAPAEPEAPTEALEPTASPSEASPAAEPSELEPEPEAEALAPAPAPAIPVQRDLGAELRSAIGVPADCVKDYRPASATTIVVRIGAVVRPTGMIIEPSASGTGLSTNDRRCIEARVGAVVLEPLEGSTSETVSTSIGIPYEPPVVESDVVAAPPPPPDDVVQALPKKKPIAPSGVPIEGPDAKPIEGPDAKPIDGPRGVPIDGPDPVPIHQN